MSIAYWCVLAGALLPYPFTLLAKSGPGFSNRTPRDYLATVSGWRKRADWVQQNSFEAFPAFAAAVIVAQQLSAPQHWVDGLAMGWVAARLGYGACYIADAPGLRSLAFTLALGCVVALFVLAA